MMKKIRFRFLGRLRNAWTALCGKPAGSIKMGLIVKRCDECDRSYCGSCVYKQRFEHWMLLRNCHDCLHNRYSSCGVCPAPGEDIRINCPLWEPKKEENHAEL